MIRRPPRSPLFPYTPLSRSAAGAPATQEAAKPEPKLRKDMESLDEARQVPPATPAPPPAMAENLPAPSAARDRKSTRLNSSHLVISYAVFCLKKKKNRTLHT